MLRIVLPALVAAAVVAATPASALQSQSGTVVAVRATAVTLNDGSIFHMPPGMRSDGISVGDVVVITYGRHVGWKVIRQIAPVG